ncbi:4873_t:CDS:1, partial [Rhizophagus irregularis]
TVTWKRFSNRLLTKTPTKNSIEAPHAVKQAQREKMIGIIRKYT